MIQLTNKSECVVLQRPVNTNISGYLKVLIKYSYAPIAEFFGLLRFFCPQAQCCLESASIEIIRASKIIERPIREALFSWPPDASGTVGCG